MQDNLYPTDVAMYAVWDSDSMKFITSYDVYSKHFVEEKTMVDLMNKGFCVIWFSGSDGFFKILPRVEGVLTEEEKTIIHKKSLNHRFVVGGDVYLGSPEWVGFTEQEGIDGKYISKFETLEKGTYSVDIYCLLRTEEGGRKFIDYVLIFNKVASGHSFPIIEKPPRLNY